MVLVEPLVEASGAERERRDQFVRPQRLARAGHDALLDEVDDSVEEQLRVDAEVAVIAELGEHRVRDRPDADLERRAVGNEFDGSLRDRRVTLVGQRGRDPYERLVALTRWCRG